MSSNSTISGASIAVEESFYVGVNIQDVLYGIQLYLYFETMHIFLVRRRASRKSDMSYAIFSSLALLLTTIWVAVDAMVGLKVLLLNQGYSIGPVVDLQPGTYASDPFIGLGAAVAVILQQMTNSLMLYRCQVLWDSRRAIIIPSVLWLFTLAFGILIVWVASTPEKNYHSGLSAQIGLAYYSISISLNTTLTSMICYRVVRHAETMKEILGDQRKCLSSVVIMLLVESALPYTLSAIALIVTYGTGSLLQTAISRVYILMMGVSPQILILRLAERNARQVRPPPSVVRFLSVPGGIPGLEHGGRNGTEGIQLDTLPVLKSGEDGKVGV